MRLSRTFLLVPIALGLVLSASGGAKGGYTFRTIDSFQFFGGGNPSGNVVLDAQGNLFGTAMNGGAHGVGAVFEVAAGSSAITTLASFDTTHGSFPSGGLAIDAAGNLYGSTMGGGRNSAGTAFEVVAGSGAITSLASFGGVNGATPTGGVSLDAHGNLYGTTQYGGFAGFGVAYEVVAGSGFPSTLSLTGASGKYPVGGLVVDAQGNLFGTTSQGGPGGGGAVFEISATSGQLTTIASFNGANGSGPGGLLIDAKGDLFGTTTSGGLGGRGTVFEIAAGSSTITTLASFDFASGYNAFGRLTLDAQGNLFGTTSNGGPGRAGTVFEIVAGSGTITTLTSFDFTNGGNPVDGLAIDAQGNLFGTTSQGGAHDYGTVFELVNNTAVVPEPASLLALSQAAVVLGIGLAARARRVPRVRYSDPVR